MKLKEAYEILGIEPNSSLDEAKKVYKKKVLENHPDRIKDDGSKMKKINEAYECIKSGKSTDQETFSNHGNPFGAQHFQFENIETFITISFKESVLGCKKDLKFNRKSKCSDCNGQGEIPQNNGCDKCGGKGRVVNQQGNMVIVTACHKCYGRTQTLPCKSCNSEGLLHAEVTITVTIPGGVQTGNVLRLSGMGNYIGNFGPLEQHTDVFLHLSVIPESDLRLIDKDVVCTLQIDLLEALTGCHKNVKTILGDKEIEIKPRSRNMEEVIIPYLGVNKIGNQRVILDVVYPKDINNLINTLSER